MKIDAKPINKFFGALLLITIISIYCIDYFYYYPKSLPLVIGLFKYLIIFIFILWVTYFFNYHHISYEIREDGVYLLRRDKVFKRIPYNRITQAQIRQNAIYLQINGFWRTDQVLRPINYIDTLYDAIDRGITTQSNSENA